MEPHPRTHAPSTIRPRTRVTAVVLALTAVLGLAVAAAAPASAASRGPCLRVVHGSFVDPGLVLTNPRPADDSGTKYVFDASGGTQDSGDLTGSTTYTGTATVDLTTNTFTMSLTETFTGTVAGIGTGHLTFQDQGSGSTTGAGQLTSLVVGGDGDLAHVRGALRWSWSTVDANGGTSGNIVGLLVG